MYKRLLKILAVLCPLAVIYHGALHQNKPNKEIKNLWNHLYIGFTINVIILFAFWI